MPGLRIGCVADDFTGASDIASFFQQAGLEPLLFNGIPEPDMKLPKHVDCVVIALKTRTMERDMAVKLSLQAFGWLDLAGALKLYFKYCSTFDSTPTGNIGPVADAVMEAFQLPYTVLCPSLPVNGRTVKDGRLYVNRLPLHESHMKDHPLTPMRQSDIADLMAPQSRYPCHVVGIDVLPEYSVPESEQPFYLIPDYYEEEHGSQIVKRFRDCRFFTGGSGLGGALATALAADKKSGGGIYRAGTLGAGLILAGSCSAITLKQIEDYQGRGCSSYQVEPLKLLSGEETPEHIWDWIAGQEGIPLVYSSAAPAGIVKDQAGDQVAVGERIENLMAKLALLAVTAGRKRIIVAGGETSGAVTKALGFRSFYLSDSVAPGVPVMIPAEDADVRLVLKSGNFGQTDFFRRAVLITEKGDI